MLHDTGAEIDEATSGNAAVGSVLQAAEEGRPYKFVLLDVAMPSVDGFEVARRVRSHHLPLKLMLPMLSSDELKSQITRLQQLGLPNYLVKPIARKDLLDSLRLMIDDAQNEHTPVPDARPIMLQTGPRRILVAEDSPDNRLVIAAYLRREPHHVDFVETGKQAFDKFVSNVYDLVLMDIQMPEMDGLEATRAIRRWEREQGRVPTPIVALTAYALEEDVQRTFAAGCNWHISKPLKRQALVECIQAAIQMGGETDSHPQSSGSRYYS
jgi:CheY-like chemotaxis protein